MLASVERPDFVEVAWHLIFGRLPRRDELEAFQARLDENAALPEGFHHLLEGFLARGRHGRQVTFILKDASQGFTDAHFIVNHKNSWFHVTIPAIR